MANYIEAIKNKLIGHRDIELSDLEVYLTNRVAIGEHPHIGEEIEKKLDNVLRNSILQNKQQNGEHINKDLMLK